MQSRELAFAIDACQKAGQIALKYWKNVDVSYKSPDNPVTQADLECEELLRSLIDKEFPNDHIIAEESTDSTKPLQPVQKRTWYIDPIDGTSQYVLGNPFFSTFLAMGIGDDSQVGVIHAPALGLTYWAETGQGAFKNGTRIAVSDCRDLSQARFFTNGKEAVNRPPSPEFQSKWPGFRRLAESTARPGCFPEVEHRRGVAHPPYSEEYCQDCADSWVFLCLDHVLTGKLEFAFWAFAFPWDNASPKIIIQEAGGRYCDGTGNDSLFGGGEILTNGKIHDEAISILLQRA